MATSDNYLRSIKCWLKLHSNLKEGNETEDWKSDKASVSAGCHHHSPQDPVLGLQSCGLNAAAILLTGVWRESELSHLTGTKNGLHWSTARKDFQTGGTKKGRLPETTLTYHHTFKQ